MDEDLKKLEKTKIDLAVDEFAKEMKRRLYMKIEKGYLGWNDPRSSEKIERDLRGDFNQDLKNFRETDIAARAMFLFFINRNIKF